MEDQERRARYLVDRYADLLLRLGYTWLSDRDDAQDICQTVLIKLLKDGRAFPDAGQERAWVIRLAGAILAFIAGIAGLGVAAAWAVYGLVLLWRRRRRK